MADKMTTHFVPFWQRPDAEGMAVAVCGASCTMEQHTAVPTCQMCEDYFKDTARPAMDAILASLKRDEQ